MSTITSVRKRGEEPRREGARDARPLPALGHDPGAGIVVLVSTAAPALPREPAPLILVELDVRLAPPRPNSARGRLSTAPRDLDGRSSPVRLLDHRRVEVSEEHGVAPPREAQPRARSCRRSRAGRDGVAGASLIAPRSARSSSFGARSAAAHDIERRLAARPQLEAESALRDEDLESVERARAVLSRGGEQRGWIRGGRPCRRHTSTHRPDRTSARVG